MKKRTMLICGLALFCPTGFVTGQVEMTARAYYDELYRTGGLDNFADEFVCFHDRTDLQTFFILGRSDGMKQLFQDSGELTKMTRAQQEALKKGFLIRVGYNKGIANGTEFLDANKTHDTYTEDFDLPGTRGAKSVPMRISLQINWDTLRYRNSIFKRGGLAPEAEDTGRCEQIPDKVRQHGHRG